MALLDVAFWFLAGFTAGFFVAVFALRAKVRELQEWEEQLKQEANWLEEIRKRAADDVRRTVKEALVNALCEK